MLKNETSFERLKRITINLEVSTSSESFNPEVAVKSLKKLEQMQLTLAEMRDSGVGKIVSNLRKHEHKLISQYSIKLRDKWREIAVCVYRSFPFVLLCIFIFYLFLIIASRSC